MRLSIRRAPSVIALRSSLAKRLAACTSSGAAGRSTPRSGIRPVGAPVPPPPVLGAPEPRAPRPPPAGLGRPGAATSGIVEGLLQVDVLVELLELAVAGGPQRL